MQSGRDQRCLATPHTVRGSASKQGTQRTQNLYVLALPRLTKTRCKSDSYATPTNDLLVTTQNEDDEILPLTTNTPKRLVLKIIATQR